MAEAFQDLFDSVTNIVDGWIPQTKSDIVAQINNLRTGNNKSAGDLARDLKVNALKKGGIADGVRFRFNRYGVFWEKGVGRGWPIEGSARNAALVNAASKSRQKAPWFNPILEEKHKELSDQIAATTPKYIVRDIKKLLIN